MTRKQAGVIAVIAFAALLRPMVTLIGLAEIAWRVVFQGCVQPRDRLLMAIADAFGAGAAQWADDIDCMDGVGHSRAAHLPLSAAARFRAGVR